MPDKHNQTTKMMTTKSIQTVMATIFYKKRAKIPTMYLYIFPFNMQQPTQSTYI